MGEFILGLTSGLLSAAVYAMLLQAQARASNISRRYREATRDLDKVRQA